MMKYWIWLTQIPLIGSVTANRLLNYFKTPENIYFADKNSLSNSQLLSKYQLESILSNKNLAPSQKIEEPCCQNNIFFLPRSDSFYPSNAKSIQESPVLLYAKGILKPYTRCIGIVGARRCTQESKQTAVDLSSQQTASGAAIISGMAKGIDSYAHTACLKNHGYTIAVLGNGLDICYPAEHNKLMEYISQKGLLLSEYPPQTPPSKYTFPKRNRIISACADELYVISSSSRSGALITASYAHKYNRPTTFLQ